MGYLLPALTGAKFENQRDVVLNERRQNYENRPYGFAGMAIVGGAVSARPSVSLDDDRRRRRHPRGAARRRAARFSRPTTIRATRRSRSPATSTPTSALELATRYFGDLEAGDEPPPVDGCAAGRPWSSSGCCSRIASSCRGSTSRGTRRRCSPQDDAELDLRRGDARQRQDVAAVSHARSTSSGSRPRSLRRRTRASSAASFRSSRPRRRATRWPSSTGRGDSTRSRRSSTKGRPPPRWSAAWRRPRRTSSIACRRSAASAASPIS